ncbi:MAG: glutamine-hydrolyzing GMP synthase [Candidatus Lokiarchaeota archaeon]|nr:glutamine-hydrolyzing GMP synthase [Candidatus Harpocratesius repetitus]
MVLYMDTVIVFDFGSQLAHLIARRVRDLGVYSEIVPYNITREKLEVLQPIGIIFSGGPSSVYEQNAPKPNDSVWEYIRENQIPLLGLCYGHHLIAQKYGGLVEAREEKEFGKAILSLSRNDLIFSDLSHNETVWMSHGDQVVKLPPGFEVFGSTETCPIAAMGDPVQNIFTFQFHAEVHHTENGSKMFQNFLFNICHASQSWKVEHWIEKSVKEIRSVVQDKSVILGLSGGVDSSVVSILLKKAIQDQVHLIFVNNGLLRKNEVEQVCEWFRDRLHFSNFHLVDASDLFLERLNKVTDPEQKRKIIGHTFIEVFEKKARELEEKYPNVEFLAQGTIYPDRVESQAGTGGKSSSKIKSHHNLTLPENMKLKIIEPLRDLYKDEVRKLGQELGLPSELIQRHPFPGPGLAVRCIGDITKEKLDILREADAIVIEEIKKAGLYNQIWQAFAVYLPVKSVGVMGDFRTFENICAVRIVESIDAMTANFAKIDWNVLERISSRIINEVRGFNRVVYDISNKPPSTIEFE